MPHFDASSCRLELLDRLYAAYRTLDIKNADPFMAKDSRFKAVPELPGLPEETKEQHFERYGAVVTACANLDVGVRRHHSSPQTNDRYRLARYSRRGRSAGESCCSGLSLLTDT